MNTRLPVAAALIVMVLLVVSCPSPGPDLETVATPQFTPAAGAYVTDENVTITCPTSGATIYYTTDGSTPNTSSSVFSTPIAVAGDGTSMTIKAIAVKSGMTTSAVASADYGIFYQVATPVISPSTHDHFQAFYVTITDATPGATIYYTTDGSPATTSSTVYSVSIPVSGDDTTWTIRAIADRSGFPTSSEALRTYWVRYIYTAGWYYQGTRYYPCYWMGTNRTVIDNGTAFDAESNSVWVDGNGNVFTCGWRKVQPYKWAVRTFGSNLFYINDSLLYDAEATSIWYDGSYQYTAGWYENGSTRIPCYWKDAGRTDLPYGTGGTASSIYLSGADIYTAGDNNGGTPSLAACYWKNTTKYDLPSGTVRAQAFSIFVNGSTIYTAGYYNDASKSIPCYWTGTTKTDLAGDGSHDAVAWSVCESSGTVYTAGSYLDGTKRNACYWTGTTRTELAGDGTHDADTSAIRVLGSYIIVSGSYMTASARIPCFWVVVPGVSNTRYDLDIGSSVNGMTKSLYIVP
ncbi:MAG: chitobiase/beta-hexosaminidase C-terminal domain-containing protein [Spirochaetes bacterium]|nr:chitobiase/beta-hexosaminidase C-terminal domain-containing protein [Spirochaetota bacterium]